MKLRNILCNKNIIINIRNTYKDEGQFEDNLFISRKKDIEYHGFGLQNVRECIEKNDGLIDIEIKEKEFVEIISIKR